MGIMPWSRSKSSIFMLAGEHKVDGFFARKRIWASEEVQPGQAPVNAVEPQMFCQPVFQFISSCIQALDVFDMSLRCELQLIGQFAGLRHGAEV